MFEQILCVSCQFQAENFAITTTREICEFESLGTKKKLSKASVPIQIKINEVADTMESTDTELPRRIYCLASS